MTAYKLIIPGDVPSLKNSKQLAVLGTLPGRNGLPYKTWLNRLLRQIKIVPSKAYQRYARRALPLLKQCNLVGYDWQYPVTIHFYFYRATRRKFDHLNIAQGPLDLMVEAGILADDDMAHVIPGVFEWGVDKDNPRVEIVISEGDK